MVELDERLRNDCFELLQLGFCRVLLMNNASLPWFILVPDTEKIEICELSADQQAALWDEVNRIAAFVRSNYRIDKLNIAAIGNVVSQLHIHVVGRRQDDYCWPGVVWGAEGASRYTADEAAILVEDLRAGLSSQAN
jgi:diadenosine tetraphosphate (Ap4A) HIT family hydrolase